MVVGNPGVGKSALLNGLIGEVKFASGVSFGCGLTSRLQIETYKGNRYLDTPGLQDVKLRKQAAAAIQEALKVGGEYKIIFVITLEAGRVRPMDVATIRSVLNSAEEIGCNYGIIVNKVSQRTIDQILLNPKNEDPPPGALVLGSLFATAAPTIYVHYMLNMEDLEDTSNSDVKLPSDLVNFVESIPAVRISKVGEVDCDSYDSLMEGFQAELQGLFNDNSKLAELLGSCESAVKEQLAANPNKTPVMEKLQRAMADGAALAAMASNARKLMTAGRAAAAAGCAIS